MAITNPAVISATINSTIDVAQQQLVMAKANAYYEGKMKRTFIVRPNEPDDNVQISLCKLVVDTGVQYLFGDECQSQIQGDGVEAQQMYLDNVWKRNDRYTLLVKLATSGGVNGHAFVRFLLPQQDSVFPRFIILDPQLVDVVTNPDDLDDVWQFTITASPDEEENSTRTIITTPSGQAGYKVEGVETRWEIIDQERTGGVWQTTNSMIWPYPWCPIAHTQNLPRPHSVMGESDITADVIHLVDVIDRIASMTSKTLRYFTAPLVYTKGMGARTIDRSVDNIVHLPSSEASMEILEMQSNLEANMNFLDRLLNYFAMVTRTPLVTMGVPDNLGAISGVALRLRFQPLVQKTEIKRRLYGKLIECLDQWTLEVGGFGPADAHEINITWPNIVPQNYLEERQVAQLDLDMGITSRQEIASRFNLDYETEMPKLQADPQSPYFPVGPAPADGTRPGYTPPITQTPAVLNAEDQDKTEE